MKMIHSPNKLRSHLVVVGDHDRCTQGEGRVGARPGGGGTRIKKFHVGEEGFPYGGIFSMWAVFSLHVDSLDLPNYRIMD